MKTYLVKALFPTVQGEGYHAGTPAVFVRLVGCNLWSGQEADRKRDAERNFADCPLWCDTDFTREGARRMTAREVVEEVALVADGADLVVVTGGEPLLQLDAALVRALVAERLTVAVETNGTVALDDEMLALARTGRLFVTCSPKLVPARLRLQIASEVKVVVPDYAEHAQATRERLGPWHAFVQPRDPTVLVARHTAGDGLAAFETDEYRAAAACALAFVRQNPGWRISTQTHKLNGYP